MNTIARVTELSATSDQSFEDAINSGIARANQTLRNVKGAWVKEMGVECKDDGSIGTYKVNLLVTFVLEGA